MEPMITIENDKNWIYIFVQNKEDNRIKYYKFLTTEKSIIDLNK